MRGKAGIIIALIVGAGLGASGIETLRAQVKAPPGYYVTETIDISDAAGFQKAIADSNIAHKAHGGRYLVLGGQSSPIVGDAPKRFTIIAFDSFDQAQNWLKSTDYAPIQSAVGKSAKTRSFVIEGVAP